MTRQEKRYFKLYAARHVVSGSTSTTDLFDAIGAMSAYDEAEVHRRFAGAAFLNRFTVTKHRLYDTILASLEAYHANSSVDARIRRSLHQVEILFQRGLYADAERMLRSVKQMGEQHGRGPVLLEALDWERRLLERTNYQGTQEAQLQQLSERSSALIRSVVEQEELWQLKSRSFMLIYRTGRAQDAERTLELQQLLDHPLLAQEAMQTSPKATFLHHHIRSAIAFASNEPSSCEQHLVANLGILRAHPGHFEDEPNMQLSVLSNLAFIRCHQGRLEEALADLKAFKQFPATLPTAPSADLELKMFAMGASLELTVLCRMGRFAQAMEKLATIEQQLLRFEDDLSRIRKAGIRFQAAWACFGAGRLDAAARWCQSVLNEKGIEQHEEVHSQARLLDLLILVETGKKDLLKYAARNVERFLRGHGRHHRAEEALVRYAKAMLNATNQADARAAAALLCQEVQALQQGSTERAVLDHFDPLCYALAKASGKPMAEIAAGFLQPMGKTSGAPGATDRRAA